MTINDLLAPNERVQLSGTVTRERKSTNIYLTNQCLYLYCEKDYSWEVQRYDCITNLRILWHNSVEWLILVDASRGDRIIFTIGNNHQWADSIFKCLKHGWDDAKHRVNTGTTSGDGNPFNR